MADKNPGAGLRGQSAGRCRKPAVKYALEHKQQSEGGNKVGHEANGPLAIR